MRTTLDLPDALFKEVKMRAVQQGVTLKELLATYIQAGMRVPNIAEKRGATDKSPRPLPIAWERIPGEPLTPARSNAELYAILEEEDIENLRRVYGQTKPQ
jgi:hypothetical protein